MSTISKYTCSVLLLAGAAVLGTAFGSRANAARLTPGDNRVGRASNLGPVDESFPGAAPGEVLARLSPGADANALASQFHLQVKRKLRFAPDTYLFSGAQGDVETAASALHQAPGVLTASANHYLRFSSLPAIQSNDPYSNEQWALRITGGQSVWGIDVGERFEDGPRKDALIGLIDAGPQTSHPDIADNIDPNGFDFVLQQPYDENQSFPTIEPHGTEMASCMAAVTNNSEGISSLNWEGVKVLPCSVGELVIVDNVAFVVPNEAAIIDAIYYCIDQQCDVISMSLGGPVPDDVMEQALIDAHDQGIVAVAASGNERDFDPFAGVSFPAAYDSVIAVGAVGPGGDLAFYSNTGPELDLVAPGGNDSTFFDTSREILAATSSFSIFNKPGYDYGQGTSQATAFTSGAIATLVTQGALDVLPELYAVTSPADRADAMRQLLIDTARSPVGRFTPEFGFGLLSVDGALKRITHYIDLTSPVANEVTASFAEPVEARIVQPNRAQLQDGTFDVLENGVSVLDNTEIIDPVSGTIRFTPDVNTRFNIGVNDVDVQADSALDVFSDPARRTMSGDADGFIPARAFRFRVRPRTEYPGVQMMTIPYQLQDGEAQDLSFLSGGNLVRLARWQPDRNRYAIFDVDGSPRDPGASLTTADAGVARPPIGVGYWGRVKDTTQLQILGSSERSAFYRIPLKPGWNMVGNPFPFRIPYGFLSVEYGNEVLSMQDAVDRKLVQNALWRYQDGRYSFTALPGGELVDWESHWVRSFANLTLIVPRLSNGGTQSASAPMAPANDGWRAALTASAGGQTVGQVFVGASRHARNGYDSRDLETPPAFPGHGDFRIRNASWGRFSGAYAQDVRQTGSSPQQWTLEVETSKPGTPVKLTWGAFPAGTRAFLRDDRTGNVRVLGSGGSYAFVAPRAGKQQLTLVALPV